jgi:hypothetical protein
MALNHAKAICVGVSNLVEERAVDATRNPHPESTKPAATIAKALRPEVIEGILLCQFFNQLTRAANEKLQTYQLGPSIQCESGDIRPINRGVQLSVGVRLEGLMEGVASGCSLRAEDEPRCPFPCSKETALGLSRT